MKSVRLGIIGVGGMGTSHSQYLARGEVKRCEVTAVCDIDAKKLGPFAHLKTYADSRELIRSRDVDAVIIATPHYDHTTIGIDALNNGIHVLSEKPISVHKRDCERLIAAHEAHPKLVFAAMFQMRTEPVWKRVRAMLADGELGDLVRITWIVTAWYRTEAYYASGGWRATWKGEGGGVLLNQCPHNLDLLQWMTGMPKRVHAFCGFGKYHHIETEDDVTAYLEYDNGATGLFVASTGEAPGTDRLEIAGDRGKLLYENGELTFHRNIVSTRTFTRTAAGSFDRPEAWKCAIPIPSGKGGHTVITQNFINAILDREPLIAPAEEGIHSVELANAMLYSAFTGKGIDIPLNAPAYERHLKALARKSKFKKTIRPTTTDITKSFR